MEPEPVRAVLARRVRDARKTRDWTQQDLADAMERVAGRLFPRSSVAKVEQGQRDISLDTLLALSHALGVPPIHLVLPLDDETPVQLTRTAVRSAGDARRWMRGHFALEDDIGSLLAWLLNHPDSELQEILPQLGDEEAAMTRYLMALTPAELAELSAKARGEGTDGSDR